MEASWTYDPDNMQSFVIPKYESRSSLLVHTTQSFAATIFGQGIKSGSPHVERLQPLVNRDGVSSCILEKDSEGMEKTRRLICSLRSEWKQRYTLKNCTFWSPQPVTSISSNDLPATDFQGLVCLTSNDLPANVLQGLTYLIFRRDRFPQRWALIYAYYFLVKLIE
jgi:hypothetical protein